jgi:hypothetical protein
MLPRHKDTRGAIRSTSVKAGKVATAPTAITSGEEKDLQTEEIFDGRYAVDTCRGAR